MPLRSCPPRRHSMSEPARSGRPASLSAAWHPSPGERAPPRRCWQALSPVVPPSGAPPRPRWPTPGPPATTPSRSSLRSGSSRGRWRLPRRERPSGFPPFPLLPSLPFLERIMPPEISPIHASAHIRHGSNAGQPLTRRDGILKVTGAARYAADNHPAGMLYAVLAVSSIARGRVTFLDIATAKKHPRVVDVMTPGNTPKLALDPDAKQHPFMFRIDALQNDGVRYAHQPIALVIAETLEAATEG